MAKKGESRRIRDLPIEKQREILHHKAEVAAAKAKKADADAALQEHLALIKQLKEGG